MDQQWDRMSEHIDTTPDDGWFAVLEADQPQEEVEQRADEAHGGHARHGDEEEREVRVERRVLGDLDVVLDPVRERGGREDEDHRPGDAGQRQGHQCVFPRAALADSHVRADPREDDVRAAVAVVVRLLRLGVAVLLLRWRLAPERGARGVPDLRGVFALRGHLDLEHVVAAGVLHLLRATEILGGAVVTFGSPARASVNDVSTGRSGVPCDIVQIAHRVHH